MTQSENHSYAATMRLEDGSLLSITPNNEVGKTEVCLTVEAKARSNEFERMASIPLSSSELDAFTRLVNMVHKEVFGK
jgi:hypothetical protein